MYLVFSFLILLGLGAYLLFKDTMNRIQYIEHLRLYWITKNTARSGVPFIAPSFMRQTQAPFWHGTGVEVRFFKWTFQLGLLRGKGVSPIEFEDLDVPVPTIRDWGRPDSEVRV
jgi:hypothetical protein